MAENDKYPSELAERFQIRLPAGLRDRIKAYAEKNGRSMNTEIVRALEEAFPKPIAAVSVRSLEWSSAESGNRSTTPFGEYRIPNKMSGEINLYSFVGGYLRITEHTTIEDAKAAAQADYEARIRIALA